jgi:hypothetical protein
MGQIIKVQFSNGDSHMAANESQQNLYHREYDYFYLGEGLAAAKGQYAVVEAQGVLKIVKIVGVGKFSNKATKYAITVFNLTDHKERIATAKQVAELREAILARAAEAKQMQAIRELAESDEGLKKMLEELKELESKS